MAEVIFGEEEHKTLKDKIRDILERKEQARNSDKFLIWYFWKYEEGIDSLDDFVEFKEGKSSRSIVRARAEIQNDDGEFLPTKEEVIRKRRIKEEKIREYYSQSKAHEIFES